MATQQPAVNTTFTRALLAWQALATPSLADVVELRSHRRIDFWPMRLTLLQRTLANPPQGLSDMERVGTPAKGFPTLEYLLNQSLDADSCRYSVWVAMDIAEHATLLKTGLNQHRQDWLDKRVTEDQVGQRYAEWVNQWLGAWERLRWTQMEQPVQRAKSHSSGNAQPEFSRLQTERNLLEWRVQLHALLQQGRVAAGAVPPQPGQLIPLEAILRGKGAIDLAQRWHHALSEVEQAFTRLSPGLPSEEVLKVSQTMKRVTVMYQREVSQVLNVPLGFSDADGD
jgi:predicted lipoprotein